MIDIYSISKNDAPQSLRADGAITGAVWAGDRAVASTSTGTVLVFSPLQEGEPGSFAAHTAGVKDIALHASGTILASVGEDNTYVLYDLQSMDVITQVTTPASKSICASNSTIADHQ